MLGVPAATHPGRLCLLGARESSKSGRTSRPRWPNSVIASAEEHGPASWALGASVKAGPCPSHVATARLTWPYGDNGGVEQRFRLFGRPTPALSSADAVCLGPLTAPCRCRLRPMPMQRPHDANPSEHRWPVMFCDEKQSLHRGQPSDRKTVDPMTPGPGLRQPQRELTIRTDMPRDETFNA
jgi:hypothetical protein